MTEKLGVFVKNSSRSPVITGLQFMQNKYIPHRKLVSKTNPLKINAIQAIKNHKKSKPVLKYSDVRSYISASSISHLIDGWDYLSNSVNSYINGNAGVAIHLAYYAELRAVMSILASEGIGVFDKSHLGLVSDTKFEIFDKWKRKGPKKGVAQTATHVFVWEALAKWCQSITKPSHDILRIFKVNGYSFSELLPGFHPLATDLASSTIAKKWLKEWAFDISRFKNDRESRNFVSYRPQTIDGFTQKVDLKDNVIKAYSLFNVLSPNGNNPFDYLDKLLLKALFEELYTRPQINSGFSLSELVQNSFENLGGSFDSTSKRILLSPLPIERTHLIFSESKKLEKTPLPVISRASLLLRVSTGYISLLLKDALISKTELSFIWDYYGFNNGFWDENNSIDDFYQLWYEIESAYNNMKINLDEVANFPYTMKQTYNEEIGLLSQFNRSLLWGI